MRLRHCRLPYRCPVLFQSDGLIGEGVVCNLSPYGCAVDASHWLLAGPMMRLHIFLPSDSITIGSAAIRWCQASRFGVEFLGDIDTAAMMATIIRARLSRTTLPSMQLSR